MLNLETLRFKGIGRFVEEQTIDFKSLGKFVQLGGQNNNTGGSSGAGKSTVFMALDYLFGISNRPSTVLKSRYSEEGIFVEGTFLYNGIPLTITRAKKLSIVLDGVETTGSSSIAEEKLDQIIGMADRELFRKILHKRQKEGGFFLQMAPKEINDFLIGALELGNFKKKIQLADDKIEQLAKKKEHIVSSLTSARSGLQATQESMQLVGAPPTTDVDKSIVLNLKEISDKSSMHLSEVLIKQKLEAATVENSRPNPESSHYDRARLSALESELESLKNSQDALVKKERERQRKAIIDRTLFYDKVVRLRDAVQQGDLAMAKISEASDQLKKIKEGKCYTCGQDWQDLQKEKDIMTQALKNRALFQEGNRAKEELPAMEVKLQHLSLELSEKHIPELEPIIARLQFLNMDLHAERAAEKEHQNEQAKKNKIAHDAFVLRATATHQMHSLEADRVRGQAEIDRRTFEAALGKLKAYEEARARHENSLTSLSAQVSSYSYKVSELMESADTVKNELEMAEEIKRALKSYLSCSFDEALETISENATTMIRHLPNMANATVQLEGTKETQAGKVKEEVNAVIHMDGDSNVDIRSLCGGERTATDLAIDLAVIDYLESKANKGIDVFILDEPFGGLDTVCIEMALDVLKNSNSKKRLIIVDHNPEVKEMVESRLTVVRNGATSSVIQS